MHLQTFENTRPCTDALDSSLALQLHLCVLELQEIYGNGPPSSQVLEQRSKLQHGGNLPDAGAGSRIPGACAGRGKFRRAGCDGGTAVHRARGNKRRHAKCPGLEAHG